MGLTSNLKTYFQLVFALRNFLKSTLSIEQCREIVKKRMEERDKNFIDVVKRNIYSNEKSPYLKLLKLSGCEFGDFRTSVLRDGIEKTLEKLRESGVYLTYDEFKGRKDVVRGGKTFRFERSEFNNPHLSHYLTVRTGGTTGPGAKVPIDFEFIAQIAVNRAILYDIYNLWEVPHAIWLPILPGAAGINSLLRNIKIGKKPLKWFSQVDREYMNPSFRHKFRTKGLIYAGRLFGTRFPRPEFVSLNNAKEVTEWASEMTSDFSGCCISTYPSTAVRVCLAAKEHGIDIERTTFIVGGEPLTNVKSNVIRSVGARVIPSYAFAEAGLVGFGCVNHVEIDEVHLLRDSFAVIQHERKIPYTGLTVDAFLFTSILPRAPKILLNVEVGDSGVVVSRKCSCGFEDLGFTDHIHSIRSFEKITSEGMNLSGADISRVVEQILPMKFGGDSTDYQIVEEEDERGVSRLSVIVSPEVGKIDERDLLETILDNLKINFVQDIFSQADTICIKRIYPVSTEMGKILPLYIKRRIAVPDKSSGRE